MQKAQKENHMKLAKVFKFLCIVSMLTAVILITVGAEVPFFGEEIGCYKGNIYSFEGDGRDEMRFTYNATEGIDSYTGGAMTLSGGNFEMYTSGAKNFNLMRVYAIEVRFRTNAGGDSLIKLSDTDEKNIGLNLLINDDGNLAFSNDKIIYDESVADNIWHTVGLYVEDDGVAVLLDGIVVFSDTLKNVADLYENIDEGFCSFGYYHFSSKNNHVTRIDYIRIGDGETKLTIDLYEGGVVNFTGDGRDTSCFSYYYNGDIPDTYSDGNMKLSSFMQMSADGGKNFPAMSTYSFEVRFKTNGVGDYFAFCETDLGPTNSGLVLGISGEGSLIFRPGKTNSIDISNKKLTDNIWHVISLYVVNNTDMTVSIDGEVIATLPLQIVADDFTKIDEGLARFDYVHNTSSGHVTYIDYIKIGDGATVNPATKIGEVVGSYAGNLHAYEFNEKDDKLGYYCDNVASDKYFSYSGGAVTLKVPAGKDAFLANDVDLYSSRYNEFFVETKFKTNSKYLQIIDIKSTSTSSVGLCIGCSNTASLLINGINIPNTNVVDGRWHVLSLQFVNGYITVALDGVVVYYDSLANTYDGIRFGNGLYRVQQRLTNSSGAERYLSIDYLRVGNGEKAVTYEKDNHFTADILDYNFDVELPDNQLHQYNSTESDSYFNGVVTIKPAPHNEIRFTNDLNHFEMEPYKNYISETRFKMNGGVAELLAATDRSESVSGMKIIVADGVLRLNSISGKILSDVNLADEKWHTISMTVNCGYGTLILDGEVIMHDVLKNFAANLENLDGGFARTDIVYKNNSTNNGALYLMLDYYKVSEIHDSSVCTHSFVEAPYSQYINDGNKNLSDAVFFKVCQECGTLSDTTYIPFEIQYVQPMLGESISMVYKANISASMLGDGQVPRMKVVFKTRTIYLDGADVSSENGIKSYAYTFEGIAPHQMGDVIDVSLTFNDITVLVNGYSVKQYCNDMLEVVTDNKLITLLKDMLVYGAAAQKHQNYDTENLVDEDIKGATEFSAEGLDAYKPILDAKANDFANIKSASLWFDYTNKLMFKIQIAEDANIDAVKVTIDGKVTEYTKLSDTVYAFYTDDIFATDFGKSFEVVLTYDGGYKQTLKYSVYSYVLSKYNKQNENQYLSLLVKALYNYGQSAVNYNKAQVS